MSAVKKYKINTQTFGVLIIAVYASVLYVHTDSCYDQEEHASLWTRC